MPISGDLRVAGRYQLDGNASGTIERCDPPRSFTATWEYGDEVTWVEVRLEPEGDGRTRFTLEHLAHVDDGVLHRHGRLIGDVGGSGRARTLTSDGMRANVAPHNGRVLGRRTAERAIRKGGS